MARVTSRITNLLKNEVYLSQSYWMAIICCEVPINIRIKIIIQQLTEISIRYLYLIRNAWVWMVTLRSEIELKGIYFVLFHKKRHLWFKQDLLWGTWSIFLPPIIVLCIKVNNSAEEYRVLLLLRKTVRLKTAT